MHSASILLIFFLILKKNIHVANAITATPTTGCTPIPDLAFNTVDANKKATPTPDAKAAKGCVTTKVDPAGDKATISCAAPTAAPWPTTPTYMVGITEGVVLLAPIPAPKELLCGKAGDNNPYWYTDLSDETTKKVDVTANKLYCDVVCTGPCPLTPDPTTTTCPVATTTTTTTTAAGTTTTSAGGASTTTGGGGVSTTGGGGVSTTGGGGGESSTGAGVVTTPPGGVTSGSACSWSSWMLGQCNDTCGMCGWFSQTRTCQGPASCQQDCQGPTTQMSMDRCIETPCLFPRPNCCSPSIRMSRNGRFVCVISGTNGTGPTPTPGVTPAPTPAPCTQVWSQWSNAACNDTCGMCGQLLRNRTCDSASTCPCTGPAVETVGPCPTNVCQFPRQACCDGYTRQPVNGIYQCVSSGKKKRDTKTTWLKSLMDVFSS